MQFAFDNADFSINTLDDHDTVHTMGGIPVSRIKETVRAGVVGTFVNVPIRTYKKSDTPGLQRITVKGLSFVSRRSISIHDESHEAGLSVAGRLFHGNSTKAIMGCFHATSHAELRREQTQLS